jgi:hypothetical protein
MTVLDNAGAGATFDRRRRYRYRLWREWEPSRPRVLWIMLNPSTADEATLDPTIRRCVGFAKAWGFGGIDVVNLFAWRATDPRLLRAAKDPIGPANDDTIAAALRDAALIVAAWGTSSIVYARARDVRRLAARLRKRLFCLGTTKDGEPRHPLYVPGSIGTEGLPAARRRRKGAIPRRAGK